MAFPSFGNSAWMMSQMNPCVRSTTSLDESLRKIDDGLPFHGRSHGHAASYSRQVRYRVESVCEVALIFRHVLPLHEETRLEPLNLQFVLSRRVSLDLVIEDQVMDLPLREEMTLVPMGSLLRLTFFKQQHPNKPVISLPCCSFQIDASRSLRISAPFCFASGSVRSIHDKSWNVLLAPSSVVSSCSSASPSLPIVSAGAHH